MSGGAYHAAMQAMNCGPGTCVQGWVGWFGVYEFTRDPAPDAGLTRLLGCAAAVCTQAELEAASPIHFADASDPPVLLAHGTLDEPQESARLFEKLRSAGVPAELLLIREVRHGFVGGDEMATKSALRQALLATFEFLDRCLKHDGRPSVDSSRRQR
jgi:dipeptidyl aminopeptidase/acylaminoacyl peptidase